MCQFHQLEQLIDEPELIPQAIEEMLRWTCPLHYFIRPLEFDIETTDEPQYIRSNNIHGFKQMPVRLDPAFACLLANRTNSEWG